MKDTRQEPCWKKRFEAIKTMDIVSKELEQKKQQIMSLFKNLIKLHILRPIYYLLNSVCEKV